MRGLLVLRTGFLFRALPSFSLAERWHGRTTATPTADQIEIFRSLTPEQQDAILRQLGGGGTGIGGATSGQGQTGQRQGQIPESDLERMQKSRVEGEEVEPLIPVLKGDDSVIIEIDFHLPPRPLSQTLQSIYSAGQAALPPAPPLQALQPTPSPPGAPPL